MRALLALSCFVAIQAVAQQQPTEIDPNTKIHGGADVRGSGADAGAGSRVETEPRRDESPANIARPEPLDPKEDKPISARKPQEREREREREREGDAAKGETAKPQ
jgi:hypothetical protein